MDRMEMTHRYSRQQSSPWEFESLRQIHCSSHHHGVTGGGGGGDRKETGSTSEAEEIKSVYSVQRPASSGRTTPPPPGFDRKETARISELGPRLAGYLEMNPLFIVRRDDYHHLDAATATAPRPGSPEVVIIPLSPHSISTPPATRDSQSCCRIRKKAVIVPTFVVANIILFIITMYRNNCPIHQTENRCILPGLKRFSFQPLSQNPLLGPSSETLLGMGALESELVTAGQQGWRLISCIWLHAGVFHLLLNMLGLLTLGLQMEQEFGYLKVGLIYIVAGFGGSLLSALFLRLTISVGASGALFGLMGALLSELLINWSQHESNWFTLSQLVVLLIINLALGKMPHVNNYAHLGGCVSGILLGFVLLQRPPPHPATGTPATAAPGIPASEFPASTPVAATQRQQYEFDHQLIQLEMQQRQQQQQQHRQHHRHHHQQYQQQQQQNPNQPRTWKIFSLPKYKFVIWVLALNLLVVLYVVALIMLFRGVDVRKKCKWCRQLLKDESLTRKKP